MTLSAQFKGVVNFTIYVYINIHGEDQPTIMSNKSRTGHSKSLKMVLSHSSRREHIFRVPYCILLENYH